MSTSYDSRDIALTAEALSQCFFRHFSSVSFLPVEPLEPLELILVVFRGQKEILVVFHSSGFSAGDSRPKKFEGFESALNGICYIPERISGKYSPEISLRIIIFQTTRFVLKLMIFSKPLESFLNHWNFSKPLESI